MKRQTLAALAAAALAGGIAIGQEPAMRMKLDAEQLAKAQEGVRGVFEAKLGLTGPVVKNQPYAADGATETTQTLADGTRIHQQSSYRIYRDSEGRQRRETPNDVWISDPVANASYVLNTGAHTARRMELGRAVASVNGPVQGKPFFFVESGAGGYSYTIAQPASEKSENLKTESLGTQVMEGVTAEGTRTTTTIPEGSIGNDRPLQIMSERWYSPELQLAVMTRHVDPRNGETVFHLTNIRRSEPDPSLFQAPAGEYRISQGKE